MKNIKKLLKEQQEELFDRQKYITKEFQDYGYRLAAKLNDLEHKSLYIKLAKEENRGLLDRALSFAIDYPEARNKGKIFMWKLKELRNEFKDEDGNIKKSDKPKNGKKKSKQRRLYEGDDNDSQD